MTQIQNSKPVILLYLYLMKSLLAAGGCETKRYKWKNVLVIEY